MLHSAEKEKISLGNYEDVTTTGSLSVIGMNVETEEQMIFPSPQHQWRF